MSVVGFDFGNSSCKIAVARRRGIDVLQNEAGHRTTGTCVAFQGNQRYLGDQGVAQRQSNYKNSIVNIKRYLGRKASDPEIKEERRVSPVKTTEDERGDFCFEVQYDGAPERLSNIQVAAAMLQKLKQTAEMGLNSQVKDCVIGVPPFWDDVRRRALLDAASIAGLNVLRLINETTAVALNYGIYKKDFPEDKPKLVLFFDMGHTSTNVALVSFQARKLTVLSSASDGNLGGVNFDEMLIKHFTEYVKTKYKMDITTNPKSMIKMRKECERVKKILSANTKVPFNIEYLMNDTDVKGMIERKDFEAMVAEQLLGSFLAPVEKCLTAGNVTKDQIHSLEVVGGATRIPVVQEQLNKWFGKETSKTCDGDESVARGCAWACAMLSPSFRVREFEVHDVTPYPIELEWGAVEGQDAMEVDSGEDNKTTLFSAFNPIPSVKMISFKDRSNAFQLTARYNEMSSMPPASQPLIGRFVVSGMSAPKEGEPKPKIKVRVKLNLHGVLDVSSAQLLEELEEEAVPVPVPDEKAAVEKADGDEAAKMDTTADDSAKPNDIKKEATSEEAAEPAKKKKKIKRTDLKIEAFPFGGLSRKAFNGFAEREACMSNQDRVIAETNEARNNLESFVLEMRSQIQDEYQYRAYIDPAVLGPFVERLDAMENWIYDDGFDAQKSEFKKNLEELKKTTDPVLRRHYEATNRESHVAALKKTIVSFQVLAATTDEKYAHISAEERAKVVKECGEADEYLVSVLNKQDKVKPYQDVAVTCAQLREKEAKVNKVCSEIMSKPKPKPVPKPEPPKEEPKKEDDTNMETEGEAVASPADPKEEGTATDVEMDASSS